MKKLRWLKLDNAAKIYPAARNRDWTNVYRLSVTFKDEVDPTVLQEALNVTVKRFPSVAVRLRTGMFWYYLEELPEAPQVLHEEDCSLNRMTFRSIRKCAFRVLYYRRRMSVDIFHAVTDGNGALVFIKTLAAEYIRRRYGIEVPCEEGVIDIHEEVPESELEDSFGRYDSPVSASRKEADAYRLSGTPEPDRFRHLTTGILDADEVKRMAHEYGATVTVFLSAVMMKAIYDLQNQKVRRPNKRKPVRVLIPVNLRKLFPSNTMRNFALYLTPDIDPRLGEYTFEEMISAIHHRLGLDLNAKTMAYKFTPNVRNERMKLLRIAPLFLKNAVMKLVYLAVGERKVSICFSNLGMVKLPSAMARYVTRIDFVLGVQASSPCNCGICTYGGRIYINFIRSISESELERLFFTTLRKLGLHVYIESNENTRPKNTRQKGKEERGCTV